MSLLTDDFVGILRKMKFCYQNKFIHGHTSCAAWLKHLNTPKTTENLNEIVQTFFILKFDGQQKPLNVIKLHK